jgi:hypothetical protein
MTRSVYIACCFSLKNTYVLDVLHRQPLPLHATNPVNQKRSRGSHEMPCRGGREGRLEFLYELVSMEGWVLIGR